MKKFYIILLIILLVSAINIFFSRNRMAHNNISDMFKDDQPVSENITSQDRNEIQLDNIFSDFGAPLEKASERVIKKPFGIYVTPANSPLQPEKFQGYHTGTDFEIFPEELNIDIPVKAVCSGKLLLKKYASGYGGVAVESCELENNPITVIYGHLKLSSILSKEEDAVNTGDTIGILGNGNSVETDGERKHLHLGFRKGKIVDIRGYASSESDLSNWLDPCNYVCSK